MAIGWSCYSPNRDALGIYERGAFDALFAPVYGISASFLTATGRLGDAALDRHVGKL